VIDEPQMQAGEGTNPRTLDLSGVQITLASAATLSDVFSIEWGLRKLIFKECDLDEVVRVPCLYRLYLRC
jgi:protein phosphatase 1 regulatory subunit 37